MIIQSLSHHYPRQHLHFNVTEDKKKHANCSATTYCESLIPQHQMPTRKKNYHQLFFFVVANPYTKADEERTTSLIFTTSKSTQLKRKHKA